MTYDEGENTHIDSYISTLSMKLQLLSQDVNSELERGESWSYEGLFAALAVSEV